MRWKWILSIAATLMIALIVTVYAILSSYNFNNLKPTISQAVKDITGRELTLGGDIELKMSFTPALVVEDVSFQNAPWSSKPELAKIKRFEVQVALLPLISRNIEVRQLKITEPEILLETDNSGKWNIDFETSKKVEPAEPNQEEPGRGLKLPALTFNRVQVEKGSLIFKDGQSGKTYTVLLDNLTTAAPSTDSPVQLELKGAYNDMPFELAGTLGNLATLADPKKAWPLSLTAKAGGAIFTIDGAIEDVMNAKGLSFNVTAEGQSVAEIAKLAEVTGVPDIGPFGIELEVADPGGKLTIEKLDAEVGTEDLARLKLTGSVKNPLAQRGIELSFTIKGKDLANLEKITRRELPVKGPISISGRVTDPEVKTYNVSGLKVALGDSDLDGSVQISLAGKRPRLMAVLSSERMNLRSLLPKSEKTGQAEGKQERPSKKPKRVFPNNPLSLDALEQVDGTLEIRAGQILLPRLAVNNLTAHITLKDGRLGVKPIKAAIGGGTLNGEITLGSAGKAAVINTKLKVEGLELGTMLKELDITNLLEGNLDVNVSLKGRGRSLAALMASLDGHTSIIMGQGRVYNNYVNMLGADLSASLFRLLNPAEEKLDYTEINCLVGRFDIKKGIAESTALACDTDRMSVVGEGEIDLRTEKLDLSLKPVPKEGIGSIGVGKLSLSVGELAKPFKLSGTLAEPSLALDPTQAAITLGKSLGGMALFGPVGIAAALLTGGEGDENPCLAAIEASRRGVKVSGGEKPREEKSVVDKTNDSGTKGVVQGIGREIKKLFGKLGQ